MNNRKTVRWSPLMVWVLALGGTPGLPADEAPLFELTRGPYIQLVTQHSAILRWRTDAPAPSEVRLGRRPDEPALALVDLEPTVDHRVYVPNLLPGTRYYYAIGDTVGELAGGPDYYFATAPDQPQPTRLWIIGDAGTAGVGNFGSWLVRDAYYNYAGNRETDVWLMLGDNAYGVGTDYEYQLAVFDTYPSLLRRTGVWSTIGNHETYAPLPNGSLTYFDIFDLPSQGEAGGIPSGTENYYSFNHANIHFVCLDSELSARGPGSPMLTWLESDLEANTNEWVIAFWHSPPYSKGSHDSDNRFDNGGNMIQMRMNVNPILERYGVDLVLSGHSHDYERSYLMRGHFGFSWDLTPTMILDQGSGQMGDSGAYLKPDAGPRAGEGTVYIVAGSSGWATFQTGFHPIMHTAQLVRGSLVIDVDGRRMDARFLTDTGTIGDHFTIIKGATPEPLRLTSIRVLNGFVSAKWKSVAGQTYRIERAPDLLTGPWTAVSGNIMATGATSFWEEIASPGEEKSFYRVVQVE